MTTDLALQRDTNGLPVMAAKVLSSFRHLLDEVQTYTLSEGDEAAQLSQVTPPVSLFDFQSLKKQSRLGAAIALLRQAHGMIAQAEDTIAQQEQRIAHLEAQATTDELTGVKNRRGFQESFLGELDRCERYQSEGGLLIVVDLDGFKDINDTYGHAAGDACLRLVARTLASEIRLMDAAARLGGDEFVLLLSNTSKQKAAGRAQLLGECLNNLALAWEGNVIPVRASIGLQEYGRGDKLETIFSNADRELYACKRSRNRKERSVG